MVSRGKNADLFLFLVRPLVIVFTVERCVLCVIIPGAEDALGLGLGVD
jgi:hypothetical protein